MAETGSRALKQRPLLTKLSLQSLAAGSLGQPNEWRSNIRYRACLQGQSLINRKSRQYGTYIITTRRITSGDELKQQKGLAGFALDLRVMGARYQRRAEGTTLV